MQQVIKLSGRPKKDIQKQKIIAEDLLNPRGMCLLDDGCILVAEAGSGRENDLFGGRVSRLRPDPNNEGNYLPAETMVNGFRSINMQARMHRDEIMGISDIVCAGGYCLASQTDYVEGSRLFDLQYTPPEPRFYSSGNINSFCYHPIRKSWFAVKPDLDILVEYREGEGERVVAKLPKFAQGQDAVPVTVIYEASTQAVLISLFSGETFSHPSRKGIDFEENVGQVIRVNVDSGEVVTLITGLQFPTGMALRNDHQLLVLELCDRLLEPLVGDCTEQVLHGGYARFSGRLLSIDIHRGRVGVLAEQLDTPSNLCLIADDKVLISEGMGISGRKIPLPDGKVEVVTGRIRSVELAELKSWGRETLDKIKAVYTSSSSHVN